MALNHFAIAAINFVAVLLSIPIISAGVWLSTQPDTSCFNPLQWPIIIIGVLVLLTALIGLIGAFCRLPMLLVFYLVAMCLLILAIAGLVVFVFVVTNSVGTGRLAPSRLFFEYELDDDSGWLRQRVEGLNRWNHIKECLASTRVCADLNQTYSSAQSFFTSMLTPLQSGCCKPPTKCGYTYVSPTNWISPISVTSEPDCMLWSNDQAQLCYACSSCKAGLLANVKREWRRAELILVVTLAALICVYVMGCCAFRAARTDDIFRRYKQGYTYT